jgi:preprotein translocase subunit SecE
MLTQIYKPGQGKYTRLGSLFTVAAIVAIGCYRLWELLTASDLSFWIATMVPVVIFAALSIGIALVLNQPSVSDFMIAAEGELKKVNWSSRKEIAVSTFVVIVVVILMSSLLGLTDFVFELIFERLLG